MSEPDPRTRWRMREAFGYTFRELWTREAIEAVGDADAWVVLQCAWKMGKDGVDERLVKRAQPAGATGEETG